MASTGIAVLLSALLYFKQSYVICTPNPIVALSQANLKDVSTRELIYPRSLPPGARTTVPTPDEFGIDDWETVKLSTPDGETLSSYLLRTPKRPHMGVTVRFLPRLSAYRTEGLYSLSVFVAGPLHARKCWEHCAFLSSFSSDRCLSISSVALCAR